MKPRDPGERLGRWQTSLSAKITIIVFWGMAAVGFLVSVILLNGIDQRLAQRYAGNADLLAYRLGAFLEQHPGASPATLAATLTALNRPLGFASVEARIGDSAVTVGEKRPGYAVDARRVRAAPQAVVEIYLYHPTLAQTVGAQRKQLLLLMGAIFLVFGLSLALVLQRLLTRPFLRMVQVAQGFSRGEATLRFDDRHDDEFGYLARFINRALDQLLQQQDELRGALAQVRESEAALYQEKERAEVTLHSIGDGVITTDAAGVIQYLNPAAERLSGWHDVDARGLRVDEVLELVDEASRQPAPNPVFRCLEQGKTMELPGDTLLVRHDGAELAIADSAAPIRSKDGRTIGAVMVFHDVEQTRKLARQLSYQASHDPLTGLYNRRAFEQHLQLALDGAAMEGREHALCYLDLDQFKIVNDTCGHVAGDELLRQLVGLLQRHVRGSDVIARLGGDEFAILLKYCDLAQAREVAEKLRQAVADFRFAWQGHAFETGVSIGLVGITADTRNIGELLSLADVACYAAKDAGRNRIHVYQADDGELQRRQGEMHWVGRLRQAIAENRFRLYHQPIAAVDPQRDPVLRFEVLVRMVDENGGLVPPMAFIPAAERYNLMPAIDRLVVRNTLELLREEAFASREYLCAVNLSGQSLGDPTFLGFVVGQIHASGIEPARLCFEVTETAAIGNFDKARQFMSVLRGMGCRFALDDFGSGLSSFSYLKGLAVDYIKIDGGFVKDLVTDPLDHALVRAIHEIGQVMQIETVAEFVENEHILQALRALGVDYAQGYGIAMPRPLADLMAELQAARPARVVPG